MDKPVKAPGSCEHEQCQNAYRWYVHVRTVPQRLTGANGQDYGMETDPAGRSGLVCGNHLSTTSERLWSLPIRMPGAAVHVRQSRPSKRVR